MARLRRDGVATAVLTLRGTSAVPSTGEADPWRLYAPGDLHRTGPAAVSAAAGNGVGVLVALGQVEDPRLDRHLLRLPQLVRNELRKEEREEDALTLQSIRSKSSLSFSESAY